MGFVYTAGFQNKHLCNFPQFNSNVFVNCPTQYRKKYERMRFQLQNYWYFYLANSLSSAFYQNSEVWCSYFPKTCLSPGFEL